MQPKQFPLSSWMTIPDWDVDPGARMEECKDIGFTLIMTPPVTDDPATHEKAVALLDLCAERNGDGTSTWKGQIMPGQGMFLRVKS